MSDGTALLILPHGGRVLGLFPRASSANFFWTHPTLRSEAGARRLFSQKRWPNPGGARTWLAPSTELFIGDMGRLWQTYREPPELDPGSYRCETREGKLCLSNRARLRLYRTGGTAVVEISKTFGPAFNPLREDQDAMARVKYAGYTTSVTLSLVSGPAKTRLGLWLLIQLPRGGEMILPTYATTRPTSVFGKIPRGDLSSKGHVLRYRMRSGTTAKIAVKAVSTTGRMGYLRDSGEGQWDLVIRNFSVNPSGEYVDPPFANLSDLGYAVQACNVSDKSIGDFSEIEHHVPAIGNGTGALKSVDISQVWAFRGAPAMIRGIAKRLLGISSANL